MNMRNSAIDTMENGQLGKKVEKVTEKVTESGERLLSDAREGFDELGRAVKKTANAAVQEFTKVAGSTYSDVIKTGKEVERKLEDEIKHYPLTSVLAAFGIGAAIGLILRR